MAQSNDSYVWMFAKSVVVFLVFAWLSYTAPKVFDQFHLSQLVKLVGGIPTPLKNMSLSVGMIIPNIWKNQIHVPNHQPEMMALFLIVSNQQFLIEQLRAGGKAQIERNIESPCDGIF